MPIHSKHRSPPCDCLNQTAPLTERDEDLPDVSGCEHCYSEEYGSLCAYKVLFGCDYWTTAGEHLTTPCVLVRRDCPEGCTYTSRWMLDGDGYDEPVIALRNCGISTPVFNSCRLCDTIPFIRMSVRYLAFRSDYVVSYREGSDCIRTEGDVDFRWKSCSDSVGVNVDLTYNAAQSQAKGGCVFTSCIYRAGSVGTGIATELESPFFLEFWIKEPTSPGATLFDAEVSLNYVDFSAEGPYECVAAGNWTAQTIATTFECDAGWSEEVDNYGPCATVGADGPGFKGVLTIGTGSPSSPCNVAAREVVEGWAGGCTWQSSGCGSDATPCFVKWTLTVTSPTTAELDGISRAGQTCHYECDTWNCFDRSSFVMITTNSTFAGLPLCLCVAPADIELPISLDCAPSFCDDGNAFRYFGVEEDVLCTTSGIVVIPRNVSPGYLFQRSPWKDCPSCPGDPAPCGVSNPFNPCSYFWREFSFTDENGPCTPSYTKVGVLIQVSGDGPADSTRTLSVTTYCWNDDDDCWEEGATESGAYACCGGGPATVNPPDVGCCCEAGVTTCCCPDDPIPTVLKATLTNVSGCSCLNGQVVTLTWDGIDSWDGSFTACGQTVLLAFTCADMGGICELIGRLQVQGDATADVLASFGGSCVTQSWTGLFDSVSDLGGWAGYCGSDPWSVSCTITTP